MKSLVPWKWGQRHAAPARRNDWLDRWWTDPFDWSLQSLTGSFSDRLPSVDITEDKHDVKVKAEIPGMDEKDIDLTWENGSLWIRGEKKDDKEEKDKNSYYRECSYGSFSRQIPLGDTVDWEKAKAKYRNGILTVSLPKTEKAKKSIDIKVQ